ncbi:MAG: hypothetical protein JSS66_18880 [Armatimonadetes bacterium]|nr:hypothetical protein [Armatimonadota bacterium]
MSADELAARKGEGDMFVKIKRNHERLNACAGHDFEPDPNWRDGRPLLQRTVHCRKCGGDMKTGDAHTYLRGVAHGSGRDYHAMCEAVWPSASPNAPDAGGAA